MSIDHGRLFLAEVQRFFFSAVFFIISQKKKERGESKAKGIWAVVCLFVGDR